MESINLDAEIPELQQHSSVLKFLKNNPAYWNLIVGFICINVFIFIALFVKGNSNYLQNTPFEDSLLSTEYKVSSSVFLASSVPMVLDLTMDLVFDKIKQKSLNYCVGRLSIAIITILAGVQFVLQAFSIHRFQAYQDVSASFWFSLTLFGAIVLYALLFSLCEAKPDICTVRQSTCIAFISSFTGFFRFYSLIIDQSIIATSFVIDYILFFFVLGVLIVWIYKSCIGYKSWTTDDCIFNIYLSIYSILFIAAYFNFFVDQIANQTFWVTSASYVTKDNNIAQTLFFFAVVVNIISMIPSRVALKVLNNSY